MSNGIIRPTFYEGMILGADTLTGLVNHARNERSRHNRHLHSWGIAHGLTLTKENQNVIVQPGIAIDGTGREIVVLKAESLFPEDFAASGVSQGADPEAWFPIFLVGLDIITSPSARSMGACDTSDPTITEEGFRIDFGRPGDAQVLDEQTVPQPDMGPGGANDQNRWRVLLGYVQWDSLNSEFADVNSKPESVEKWQWPRYAGVRADEVIPQSEKLTLRSTERQIRNKPVVEIDGTKEGELRFGLQDDRGLLHEPPLLSVDAQGNLTVQGALKGEVTTGSVFVQSGIAMDGVVIPLPFGITQKQVDDGQVDIHVQVSYQTHSDQTDPNQTDPNLLGPPTDKPHEWIAIPKVAEVDELERKINCRVLWLQLNTAADSTLNYQEGPGICKYVIIASVP